MPSPFSVYCHDLAKIKLALLANNSFDFMIDIDNLLIHLLSHLFHHTIDHVKEEILNLLVCITF